MSDIKIANISDKQGKLAEMEADIKTLYERTEQLLTIVEQQATAIGMMQLAVKIVTGVVSDQASRSTDETDPPAAS